MRIIASASTKRLSSVDCCATLTRLVTVRKTGETMNPITR